MANRSNFRERELVDADYTALARFRHAIRVFLSFSESAAKECGVTPQQHQAILAIRGFAPGSEMSVGDLAVHLLIQHNSAVELVNRLQQAELVERSITTDDRRRVHIGLTPKAHALLEKLSAAHLLELRKSGHALAETLDGFYENDLAS
jgi:DNA-binding MarR family transcriptional regulator